MKRLHWETFDPLPVTDEMSEPLYWFIVWVDDIYWEIPIFQQCVSCWPLFREW